jgi:hypothetical protein
MGYHVINLKRVKKYLWKRKYENTSQHSRFKPIGEMPTTTLNTNCVSEG